MEFDRSMCEVWSVKCTIFNIKCTGADAGAGTGAVCSVERAVCSKTASHSQRFSTSN